jgi:hypothetical protein
MSQSEANFNTVQPGQSEVGDASVVYLYIVFSLVPFACWCMCVLCSVLFCLYVNARPYPSDVMSWCKSARVWCSCYWCSEGDCTTIFKAQRQVASFHEHQYLFIRQHDVTSQKTWIFTDTTVRTSDCHVTTIASYSCGLCFVFPWEECTAVFMIFSLLSRQVLV